MCVMDAAAKETAVARFVREYPQAGRTGDGHPALLGCTDVAWSQIPGCPSGIPLLFRSLLDPDAGPEARRVLGNVLMDSTFHMGAAMPTALPYLIRLAADPDVAMRSEVIRLVALVSDMSRPVDPADELMTLFLGDDRERPERGRCRAVFAEHAPLLQALLDDETLPDGLISMDDRACLLDAVAPQSPPPPTASR